MPRTLSIDEAVRATGCAPPELETLARRRTITVVRADGEWRLSVESLARAGLLREEPPPPLVRDDPAPRGARARAVRDALGRLGGALWRARPASLRGLDGAILAVGALCLAALALFVVLAAGGLLAVLLLVLVATGALLVRSSTHTSRPDGRRWRRRSEGLGG
jgi:hypothetical protein